VVRDEFRRRLLGDANQTFGSVLVDGFVAATWKLVRAKGPATLRVMPLEQLGKREAAAVEAEAVGLLRLVAPAGGEVQLLSGEA
jgi:hypothetical protein